MGSRQGEMAQRIRESALICVNLRFLFCPNPNTPFFSIKITITIKITINSSTFSLQPLTFSLLNLCALFVLCGSFLVQDFFDPSLVGSGQGFIFQLAEGDPVQFFAVGLDSAGHIPNALGDLGVPDTCRSPDRGPGRPCNPLETSQRFVA